MSDFDFQPYRDFILRHHEQQQILYTLTDVLLPLQVGTLEKREQRLEKDQEIPKEHKEEQLPVLEGLRKYALGVKREHIILVGKPGAGKSTALQQLRLALVVEGLVPVLVKLRGNASILEAITNELEKGNLELEPKDIKRLLRNQKLILLLDGVNEIPTDDLRRDLANFRNEEQYLMVPMIFTTRDLAVGGDLGISRRLEMKPLTEKQMRDFVGQRLPGNGEKLLGQLGDQLKEISETPLLLKMLCDVFGETGQIPKNKGELFRLFDREYNKFKGFPPVSEDSRRLKSEILQHLAFVMMTGDASKPTEFWLTIDRNFAEREIEKCWIGRVSDPAIKAKEWLEELLQHYLLQVAADARKVEFHHQLFQEYYAAEKLLSMLQDDHLDIVEDRQFQRFYLNYRKWTQPLKFLLGLSDNKAKVIRIVKLSLEVDWMLGAKLSGEAKPEFHNETVRLLQELQAREQLRLGWIKFNRKAKVPDWLKVELFKETRSDVAIQELLELVRHGDEYIYCSHQYAGYDAVQALGKIGSAQAINALLQIIQHSDLYPHWNFYAFSELAKIGEPATNALIQISHCNEPDLRKRATEILKNQEDESKRKAFKALAVTPWEKDFYESYDCVDTESQKIDVNDTDSQEIDVNDTDLDINQLLTQIEHEDYHRCRSVRPVRYSSDARHILDEIKSYKLVPQLLKAIESNSSSMHHEIAKVLYSIALQSSKPKETIPALLKLLESENLDARSISSRALGWLKCREAVPTLLREFQHGDYWIRFQLPDVFGEIRCTSAIPVLLEALKDKDLDIELNTRIMRALGNIGSEEVIPALQKAFQDKDPFMRRWAVYGFSNQELNMAIPMLRKAIKDKYDGVRSAAGEVLGELVHREAERKDKGDVVNKSGCKEAADILLEAIEDEHYQVMIHAEKALGKFRNDWAAHIMPSLLNLVPTIDGRFAFNALTAIQGKCKFYNYDIFCSPPPPIEIYPPCTTVNNFYGDSVAGDKVQGDKVVGDKYDIQNVGNLNTGHVDIAGNQIGENK
jgi:HEAT repeat protein